jgi:Periplasmic binding protein
VGLKPVYTNTSVEFGTSDVAPLVLGIKKSGAHAVYMALVASSEFAIVQGLAQSGVKMKANMLPSVYGEPLLDSPIAKTLGPNTAMFQYYKPVELKDKATKRLQADLKKYVGLTGVPDYGQYLGYVTCDMAVTGLEQAGKNPTRQGFIDGMHELGTYDGAGLLCQPVDISLANFGKAPSSQCLYFMQVKDGKFVVMNNGKPVPGKLVGSPEALKANSTGNPDLVTTTTAAPAP